MPPRVTTIGRALDAWRFCQRHGHAFCLDGDVLSITAGEVKARFRQLMPVRGFPGDEAGGFLNEGETPSAPGSPRQCCNKPPATLSPHFDRNRYYLNGVYMHAKEDGFSCAVSPQTATGLLCAAPMCRSGARWHLPSPRR